ncbi:MAG: S41 family peptidase [bacterium]|nr:S41 family peptidase [bacterium]
MTEFNFKKIRNFILIITLMLLAGEAGYVLGKREVSFAWKNWKPQLSIINREPPAYRNVNFELFWDVWDRLSQNYLDKSKLDQQKMVYGAIEGMTRSLGDPYTVFLPPKENEAFKEDLSGTKFGGIGAQLGLKGEKIVVVAPLKGSPAESAGVLAGDFLLKVNNEETSGWTLPEAVTKIRGEKGTKVVLTIEREKEAKPLEITVTRETILVKSVEWETKESAKCLLRSRSEANKVQSAKCEKVAYLKLSRFGDGTEDWEKAVSEIVTQKDQFQGLILDLRNNPGGYLSGAVYIASEFLKEGAVVQQENAAGTRKSLVVDRAGKLTDIPMVVIINKGSASASEIVALALKESGRVRLLGEKSFGKDLIQDAQELEGGAGLHITTAKWLSPSGKSAAGGIEPDIVVASDENDQTKDPQLEKAIEILTANSK